MKNVPPYDASYKQVSVHELNHRRNGDKSPRRSINHVHGRIFGLFEQIWKTRKHIHNLWPLLLTWFNFNPSMDK